MTAVQHLYCMSGNTHLELHHLLEVFGLVLPQTPCALAPRQQPAGQQLRLCHSSIVLPLLLLLLLPWLLCSGLGLGGPGLARAGTIMAGNTCYEARIQCSTPLCLSACHQWCRWQLSCCVSMSHPEQLSSNSAGVRGNGCEVSAAQNTTVRSTSTCTGRVC